MAKQKNLIIFSTAVIILLILAGLAYYLYSYQKTSQTLVPYFSYSKEELAPLANENSDHEIKETDLFRWDNEIFVLVKQHKLGDAPVSQLFAYLYTAQRDFAFLSHNMKGSFMGNIDVLMTKALCVFFTSTCATATNRIGADIYSNKLADLVISKMKQRIELDKKTTHHYTGKQEDGYWLGTQPYFGQDVGSWKPWLITNVNDFLAPPPPAFDSQEWKNQLNLVHKALKNITPDQTQKVVFWAGNPGTVTPPGQWIVFANEYMQANNTPLTKMLMIRSVLAMGIADSVIAVFHSKYTYWAKRPFMHDPSIKTIMPTPNHPSYPAGHSTISNAAATILTYYFPDNQKFWEQNAEEASIGRVWGGIHFPIDAEQGSIIGQKVGQAVISKVKLSK